LAALSPAARAWFTASFARPTPIQEMALPAAAAGEHVLLSAPTGSGKTLAAFLVALDRLMALPEESGSSGGVRVLYVSPMRALAADVERNLRAPLVGIAAQAARMDQRVRPVEVAVRTGDTPATARRSFLRRPADVLVTTPESLYLLLTSAAGARLAAIDTVILDEIHAVASTKRGSHLAVSLERLEALQRRAGRPPFQRIGLSATQRPLERTATFLAGHDPTTGTPRPVRILDAGAAQPLDLLVDVPVPDMGRLGQPMALESGVAPAGRVVEGPATAAGAVEVGRAASKGRDAALAGVVLDGPAAGDPVVRTSIWPHIEVALLEMIAAHRSTLVFVNSRRVAERLARRLNEAAGRVLARAHHGSVADDQRSAIEEELKAGRLPALVATSTLELGIDMGAVDLVVLVESPPSVASGLQRIGRSNHRVGGRRQGRLLPTHRHDLLVATVVASRMGRGEIEETRLVENPLDVLAQQLVAMAVAAGPDGISRRELEAVLAGAAPFARCPPTAVGAVLDMLSGALPVADTGIAPLLAYDRSEGRIRARPAARMRAILEAGTIPDRGLYPVRTVDGSRVGELDEEMVHESRVGGVFVLGATSWRILEIGRDRVVVEPAPGVPGGMPFWHGDRLGREADLGAAIGAFTRWAVGRSAEELAASAPLSASAAENLARYLAEESAATGGVVANDRELVVERFRDEVGDWRVCLLSPYGARVHAPWAVAIEARLSRDEGIEAEALWTDDGVVLRLPEDREVSVPDLVAIDPAEVEELVVSRLATSSLFAARFRESAARALLLPGARPGRRSPLWQRRLRASDLLERVRQLENFPLVLETYRECLTDAFDLPALRGLLARVARREVRIVGVETTSPSPFAASVSFGFVANFLYDGDVPLAERRAWALPLDRALLAQLIGSEELRDLIDAGALAELEAELGGLAFGARVRRLEGVADLLLRLGDLTPAELALRLAPEVLSDLGANRPAGRAPVDGSEGDGEWLRDELVARRLALAVRVGGEERLIAPEDAARYRDGLGVPIPPGVPAAFLRPVPDALRQITLRFARRRGPFESAELARRYDLDPKVASQVLSGLEAAGRLVGGAFRPGGTQKEWCDPEVLRLLRARSLAASRKEAAPVEAERLVEFLARWHGLSSPGRGLERCLEAIDRLQGVPLAASQLETVFLAARVADYRPAFLDELASAGEVVWIGAGALGRHDGRVVLLRREVAPGLARRLGLLAGRPSPADELHTRLLEQLSATPAAYFRQLRDALGSGVNEERLLAALWDLVWAGEVMNDGFGALRAFVAERRAGPPRRPRLGHLPRLGPPSGQGRWSLAGSELALGPTGRAGAADPVGERETRAPLRATVAEATVALAEVLLRRHGVVTRAGIVAEGPPGGFAGLFPAFAALEDAGRVRRGYFVAGLGGAQFALPEALDLLRATGAGEAPPTARLLAAVDPANPYGTVVPWPVPGPSRVVGAVVVVVHGQGALYLERGGRRLVALRPPSEGSGPGWESVALGTLAAAVGSPLVPRLRLEAYPDWLAPALAATGFWRGPGGLEAPSRR